MAALSLTTLQSFVERIANAERRLTGITATGGSTTTIISTSGLWQSDQYWRGASAYIKSGTNNVDQERPISDYNQAANRLTVPLAFTGGVVSAGDVVQIYRTWSRADIVNAINEAVRRMRGFFWQAVSDESITTLAGLFAYGLGGLTLPITRKFGLSEISLQLNQSLLTYPYQPVRNWKLRWNNITPTLQLQDLLPAGRILRLQYMATANEMAAQADTCGVGADTGLDEFINEWARFYLWDSLMGQAPEASKTTIAANRQQHRDEAERIRRFFKLRPMSNTFVPAISSARRERDSGEFLAGFNTPSA